MKVLQNEKGFTLIELVLIIVILGILGAVATVQFGNITTQANIASLDGAGGPYGTQLALSVNALSRIPTCAEFTANVFTPVTLAGGAVTATAPGPCAGGLIDVVLTVNATCLYTWTYDEANGSFTRVVTDITGC